MQFTTGTDHRSASKAVVQLDPLEWYDTEFKTHIAIMGGYLVVLLAHYTFSDSDYDKPTSQYQTEYFVDWVKGHIIHVRTASTTVPLNHFSNFQRFL